MKNQIPSDDNTRTITSEVTGFTRELTAADMDRLRGLRSGNITFDLTGVQIIDDLLHAVMWASRWQHNTNDWSDDTWTDYGPLREGETFADLIQSLANDGADEIRKAILR